MHYDIQSLFTERDQQTPPYQLAVNFPRVDCNPENGSLEMASSTHILEKEEALRRIERGDILIRDARHIHRGASNRTDQSQSMIVLDYSQQWHDELCRSFAY